MRRYRLGVIGEDGKGPLRDRLGNVKAAHQFVLLAEAESDVLIERHHLRLIIQDGLARVERPAAAAGVFPFPELAVGQVLGVDVEDQLHRNGLVFVLRFPGGVGLDLGRRQRTFVNANRGERPTEVMLPVPQIEVVMAAQVQAVALNQTQQAVDLAGRLAVDKHFRFVVGFFLRGGGKPFIHFTD